MPITTRIESIQSADGESFDSTAVFPEGGGPGILLLQEIFGVGEFLVAKARELASEGYVVLCPDVFWRVERGVVLAHDEAALAQAYSYMERFAAIDPDVTTGDLLAALAHLRAMPEVTGRSAVMGYCLGGRLAYEVAIAGDPDCCVAYYGSGIADRLDDAGKIACPTLFHFGSDDAYIPFADAERVIAAFSDRPEIEAHIHAGAGHAFENAFAPAFTNPEAARRSWPLTLDFLRRQLP
ncbi:MAG: dienelactone hydrolase family protein [Acidimicrobiales bacterium]